MKKSLVWSAALLYVVLLLSAVSLSAPSSGRQDQVRVTVTSSAVISPVSHQVLASWANMINTYWDDKNGEDKHQDADGDKDDRHRHRDHDPTPEPSTLLSFGAAILIGGGVLYSRRLRPKQK